MAGTPVPNTAEVAVQFTKGGQHVENTFFYELGSTITQIALDALVAAIANYVAANWFDYLPTDVLGVAVHAEDLTAGSGLQSNNTTIAGIAGAHSGAPLPNNATIAVARKSGLTGRSQNGRIFWPGLSEGMNASPNVLAVAVANTIRGIIVGTDAAAIADDWTPVVVSLVAEGVKRTVGQTTPITSWLFTDLTLDSRRRRLPGRGV